MDQIITYKKVTITIRRDDLLHPFISGNKFRKLKHNIEIVKQNKFKGILTFGGAFSNHIAATAAAGFAYSIPTVGVIRGEEWQFKSDENPTLLFAKQNGMHLHFFSRDKYRNKQDVSVIQELQNLFPDYYFVPEGGSNKLAVLGCEEIINPEQDAKFDYVCCAAGTGATISGIYNQLQPHQKAIAFMALNDYSVLDAVVNWTTNRRNDLYFCFDYNLGAYAKINDALIAFINDFFNKFGIPLDPIYTGKMFFGIIDLIDKQIIAPGSQILAIHTGGLQGIDGINKQRIKKNKTTIQVVF
ncbi:pyridoxal-phosphate dependent enzyme [Flavobacterium agricola]|uniref:Pyridoxal-phosphate dependent enzyme n=1 Tax=Flavobacterium agricola TaxID=2870839 RepID=A0ABY6LYE9_9FLAO|nr:pyridoxal-phosphate dependent enzyme [Flavobacterium agricola]UYW00567.1 pyridoxal-phosphate dependent enzyme [Flavobacterium agricola]